MYTGIIKYKGDDFSMGSNLDDAVRVVKTYLEGNNYSYSITMSHYRFFRLLRQHLVDKDELYSKPLATLYLQSITPGLCQSTLKVYQQALERLDASYHHKEIKNTKAKYETQQKYQHLKPWCRDTLDAFMREIPSEYDQTFIRTIRNAAARFLDYLASNSISTTGEITHRIVADYYRDDEHDSYKSKDVYNNCVRKFLRYLSDKGEIKASVPLTLDKFVLSHPIFIESLPPEIQADFICDDYSESIGADEYYRRTAELHSIIRQHRYSKTMSKVFRQAWKEFFIFLEANSLEYTQRRALAWATYMRNYVTQWKTFRRAFKLFEQYSHEGVINPQIIHSYRANTVDSLPKWCKADYEQFIIFKQKDSLAGSTLAMYRSCCLRLLKYMTAIGVGSWDAITPEVLKEFHRQDFHSTPEAKNAYSSRIRIFLEYLGESGVLCSTLFMAVPKECAPRVSLIKVLNNDDIIEIDRFRDQADSAMGLRNAAMLVIGLRMGIRASDISNMRFSDISWEHKTISVQQQKTGEFLKLPMPIEVGNAIYRYIIEGRPDATTSENIFVAHRVPYSRLQRGVCRAALVKALPNRSYGFHVVRKTFASRMLINDVPADRISESLGHINNKTVMRYLSTNDEKMRMCALPLSGVPVGGGVLS